MTVRKGREGQTSIEDILSVRCCDGHFYPVPFIDATREAEISSDSDGKGRKGLMEKESRVLGKECDSVFLIAKSVSSCHLT